jgi:hypothetical protein
LWSRFKPSSSTSMAQQPDIGPRPPLSSPSIRGFIPGFETLIIFAGTGRQPLAQPATWRTRVSLLVWIIPFDVSSMGGPTSSYATAGLALRVIWPHKPHHYVKVETPSGGRDSNQVPPNTSQKRCWLSQLPPCVIRLILKLMNISTDYLFVYILWVIEGCCEYLRMYKCQIIRHWMMVWKELWKELFISWFEVLFWLFFFFKLHHFLVRCTNTSH